MGAWTNSHQFKRKESHLHFKLFLPYLLLFKVCYSLPFMGYETKMLDNCGRSGVMLPV